MPDARIDWEFWVSSLVKVAEIGASILPLLLLAEEGEEGEAGSPSYTTGAVKWYPLKHPYGYDAIALNDSNEDVTLFFSDATESGIETHGITLGANEVVSVDGELKGFLTGDVSVATTSTPAAAAAGQRIVDVAFRLMPLDAPVVIVDDPRLALTLRYADPGYELEVDSAEEVFAVKTTITDPGSQVAAAAMTGDAALAAGGGTFTVPLPPGLDPDPIAEIVEATFTLSSSSYERLTAGLRDRTRPLAA